MPKAATIVLRGGKNANYYEISMKQISQQILPAGLPATSVWAYGAISAENKRGLLLHNATSLTIEARWNTPVRVKWINDLKDADGNFLPRLLPVDRTLHWASLRKLFSAYRHRHTFSKQQEREQFPEHKLPPSSEFDSTPEPKRRFWTT